MKILLPVLFGLGLLAVPAAAQIEPATPQQLQQQHDQAIQSMNNQTQQSMTQSQLGQIQDQQRRDQLFATQPRAYQEPFTPPQPVYVPPPKPKP